VNEDLFPILNNFDEQIFGSFVGGQENLKKIVQLKNKYDPENLFTGNYF